MINIEDIQFDSRGRDSSNKGNNVYSLTSISI